MNATTMTTIEKQLGNDESLGHQGSTTATTIEKQWETTNH